MLNFFIKLNFNLGPLSELYLPIDRMTKKAQGFAFVAYLFVENAVQAFTDLDGTVFQVCI